MITEIERENPVQTVSTWSMGVDLGKVNDPTAIAVIEKRIEGTGTWDIDPMKRRFEVARERMILRYLRRIPLGTNYAGITSLVGERFHRLPQGHRHLIIDATGNKAGVDFFEDAGLHPIAVTAHGGDREVRHGHKEFSVPKPMLVSTLHVALRSRALEVAADLHDGAQIEEELAAFQRKVSASGHETWNAADGQHDDTISAVCLGLWWARKRSGEAQVIKLLGL